MEPVRQLTLLNFFEPLAHYVEQLENSGLVVEAPRVAAQYERLTGVDYKQRKKVKARLLQKMGRLEEKKNA